MKRLIFFVLFMQFVFISPAASYRNGIKVVVEDKCITSYQVEQAVKILSETFGRPITGGEAQDYLVNMMILKMELKSKGIVVEDDEVAAAITSLAEKNGMDYRAFMDVLRKKDIDQELYERIVSYELLRGKYIRNFIQSEITITDQDIQKGIRELEKQGFQPLNIVLVTSGGLKYLNKIRNNFKELLKDKKYVEKVKKKGVSITQMNGVLFDDLRKDLADVLIQMKPGEVSKVFKLEGENAFVYFKGYSPLKEHMGQEIMQVVQNYVTRKKVEEEFNRRMLLLRKKFYVEFLH